MAVARSRGWRTVVEPESSVVPRLWAIDSGTGTKAVSDEAEFRCLVVLMKNRYILPCSIYLVTAEAKKQNN